MKFSYRVTDEIHQDPANTSFFTNTAPSLAENQSAARLEKNTPTDPFPMRYIHKGLYMPLAGVLR